MKLWRNLLPVYLSTWLALHTCTGIALLSGSAAPNIAGTSPSFQDIYARVRTLDEAYRFLPNSFLFALLVAWLLLTVGFGLLSFLSRTLCSRYVGQDHVTTSLIWTMRTGKVRWMLALLVALAIATLVVPWMAAPLLVAALVVSALAVFPPFLSAARLPTERASGWNVTRGLGRLLGVSFASLTLSIAGAWLIDQCTANFCYLLSAVWYVCSLSVFGLLVGVAVFGVDLIRRSTDVRRFFSMRYLVTWLRLDYVMLLAALWIAPPLMLVAVFSWFALPTIKYSALSGGVAVPWWASILASAYDAVTKHWYLSLIPLAFALGTLLHAKIVFELERQSAA